MLAAGLAAGADAKTPPRPLDHRSVQAVPTAPVEETALEVLPGSELEAIISREKEAPPVAGKAAGALSPAAGKASAPSVALIPLPEDGKEPPEPAAPRGGWLDRLSALLALAAAGLWFSSGWTARRRAAFSVRAAYCAGAAALFQALAAFMR